MRDVPAPRRQRKNFDFTAKRRKEIVLHARYVGAADTEDLDRWLIAWVWHNRKAADQIWSVMNAARNMGREITEAEASAVTEEASITRKHLTADNLARFLGVTYGHRQQLGLTTIGSINVPKRARKELRKLRNRRGQERRRRAAGSRPRAEYEANSLSATKPWEAMNMSRRTWERHRNKASVASPCTPIFLSSEDTPASQVGPNEDFRESGCATQRKEDLRLATATTMAADVYETLPLELRLAALCLPISENLAAQKFGWQHEQKRSWLRRTAREYLAGPKGFGCAPCSSSGIVVLREGNRSAQQRGAPLRPGKQAKWGRILDQPEISQYFQWMIWNLKSSAATIAPGAGSIELPPHNEKREGRS
jgi:hypothetical protein